MMSPDTFDSIPVATDDRIVLSLPEINALCLRAARGAGYPWGMAEECGMAAVWLARAGLDWAGAVLDRLTGERGTRFDPQPMGWASSGPVCSLEAGPAVVDFAVLPEGVIAGDLTIDSVLTPFLMLPFIERSAALAGTDCAVHTDGTLWAVVGRDGGFWIAESKVAHDWCCLRITTVAPDRTLSDPILTSSPIAKTSYARLDALALRMTVPATAQSQARAGGDGTDND